MQIVAYHLVKYARQRSKNTKKHVREYLMGTRLSYSDRQVLREMCDTEKNPTILTLANMLEKMFSYQLERSRR